MADVDGGYTAIYHNKIPMDIKYVDYDRNVKQIGGAEVMSVKMYSYVQWLIFRATKLMRVRSNWKFKASMTPFSISFSNAMPINTAI